MKQTIRSMAVSAAFAAILLCASAQPGMAADNNDLTGTWSGTITIPTFPKPTVLFVLTTYNAGGTAVATTSSPTDSEEHGVWVRNERLEFAATFLGFSHDGTGKVTGKFRIRVFTTLADDGKTSKGTAEADIMDLNGNVVFTIRGVTHAETRLALEEKQGEQSFLDQ